MNSCLELSVDARVSIVASLILVVSLMLGLTLDTNANIPKPWNRVSSIIGWIYFSCWSIGFYPQLFSNYYRKSVAGLSIDSIVLGEIGFVCYAIFNCAFYYSGSVQEQYTQRNNGNQNAVEANDVFFSLNATVLVGAMLVQSLIYSRDGDGQKISRATLALTAAIFAVAVLFGVGVVLTRNDESASIFTTLNLLYYLSYVKLVLTLVKYIPQVLLNYQRKSTVGWTVWGIYFDMVGGVLSISQQVLDSAATNDWTAITGDPVKFSLAFVTIVMDIEFFLQHYVWYAAANSTAAIKSNSKGNSSLNDSSRAIEMGEKQHLLP